MNLITEKMELRERQDIRLGWREEKSAQRKNTYVVDALSDDEASTRMPTPEKKSKPSPHGNISEVRSDLPHPKPAKSVDPLLEKKSAGLKADGGQSNHAPQGTPTFGSSSQGGTGGWRDAPHGGRGKGGVVSQGPSHTVSFGGKGWTPGKGKGKGYSQGGHFGASGQNGLGKGKGTSQKDCWYGEHCRHPHCVFRHPQSSIPPSRGKGGSGSSH